MFEFAQGAVRAMGPMEQESIASLADLGFRFSMDHVTDLRIEPRELAERGFRFVKVPADLLLSRSAQPNGRHPPGRLPDLLGRYGIDLIAERIEREGVVVDLLDYDVRFGQGFLFSPPRPVRAEVLGRGFRAAQRTAARSAPRAPRPRSARAFARPNRAANARNARRKSASRTSAPSRVRPASGDRGPWRSLRAAS